MPELLPSETARLVIPALKQADRCDKRDCSAQAFVRMRVKPGKYLDFCAHDFAGVEVPVMAAGYMLIDNRPDLL